MADWLHSELEDFHVPSALSGKLTANGVVPRRLAPIFRDEHELAAASDLGEEIRSALAASQFLIVLCTPDAARSKWTNAEVDAFKRCRPDGCVLAVIASGEPFASEIPGREEEECFPPALRARYDKRGRPTGQRAEPLAADMRGGADERRMGFLKLVAGMLGVGLDDLVRRESTRRHRRLAWLTAASLSGMALTSMLAVTAIQARDSARDQRREAEGLVAFMLGDLKEKLEPIGRLDALDGVGAKVLDYYRRQNAADVPDNALVQRSQALSLSAQVAMLRGNLDSAQQLYREALAGTGEAVRREPDDPKRLFDHAQNVFWIGDIARTKGQAAGAESAMREYDRLAERMVALQPDNIRYRMELQNAQTNLGVTLLGQRKFHEATGQFEAALRNIERLAAADPDNGDYQKSSAESRAWYAESLASEGRLDEAIGQVHGQIDLLQSSFGRSGDMEFLQRLVSARRSLGNLYLAQGNAAEAEREFQVASNASRTLLQRDQSNSRWRFYDALVELDLARSSLASGQIAGARGQAGAACTKLEALTRRDPRDQRWRATFVDCLIVRSRLALLSRDAGAARLTARRAVDVAATVKSPDPQSDLFAQAAAYRMLGEAMAANGDKKAALEAWRSALGLLSSSGPERPSEMAEHARLFRLAGQSAAARGRENHLARLGFRNPEFSRN